MNGEEKRYLSRVQSLGCVACRKLGYWDTPAEIHHVRWGQGAAQRASHFKVLPLCPHHHRAGGYGEAFHAGQQAWEKRFGREAALLEYINMLLNELDACFV